MKKLSAFLAIIFLAVFFIYSCQKDKSDAIYSAGESNNLKTTVTGIVLDESNAPLNGVTVTAYGQTATTNQYGIFVLKNLNANKDRCVLQFTKAGFFNRAHGLIASANTVNYVRIVLLSNTPTQSFSSSSGGTISLPDGSSAEFQPNSIVTSTGSAYTGTVNLIVKHLSPDDANFGFTIPGGDLLGKNINNEDVALYTYGMLGVELTGSSGEALQLATGTSATLTMAIAASQLASAPATIPLWYFDETTSLWKEEGTANKVGNNYVGTVNHFSWWNCDIGTESPIIKGKVIDCEGVPVPNCVVTVNGWATTLTNQNGEYQGQVPAGLALTVQVLASNNNGIILNSQLESVAPLSNNQTFIVPDLVVPCLTRITGQLKNCNGSETIDGLIVTAWSNGNNFLYGINGIFNIPVPSNTFITLSAFSYDNLNQYSFTTSFQSLTANSTLTIDSIYLCTSISLSYENGFILNGNGYNNQLFIIDTTSTSSSYWGTTTTCSASGHDSLSGGECFLLIGFVGNGPGIYNYNTALNDLWIDADGTIDSANYQAYYPPSQGTIEITEYGPIGGRIIGTFSGTLANLWGGVINVTNGKINVTRTQ